eukprot:751598-Hanusia_phi.AAC.1
MTEEITGDKSSSSDAQLLAQIKKERQRQLDKEVWTLLYPLPSHDSPIRYNQTTRGIYQMKSTIRSLLRQILYGCFCAPSWLTT